MNHIRIEGRKLFVLGVAWIMMGLGTFPLSDEPAWTVDMLGALFVLGGATTVAYSFRPRSAVLYRYAYALSTRACLGRAVMLPVWKYAEQDTDWVSRSILGMTVWLVMYWLSTIFWKYQVGELKSYSTAYHVRKTELRGGE